MYCNRNAPLKIFQTLRCCSQTSSGVLFSIPVRHSQPVPNCREIENGNSSRLNEKSPNPLQNYLFFGWVISLKCRCNEQSP